MNKPQVPLPTKVEREERSASSVLNFVDKTIAFFKPQSGLERAFAREQLIRFGYNDKEGKRSRPQRLSGSEEWNKNRDRLKMMADARELAQYDWIGGIIARVVLYVCGKMTCKSATGDDGYNAIYDEYFYGWCGEEVNEDETTMCDVTGRHRLIKLVQMAFAAFLVDGDHGFIEIDPTISPTGRFCLQNIGADRIGSPNDSSTDENYIGGIVTGDPGNILAYRVFERTRTGLYTNPNDIEPANFIHVADLDKDDEYRGRTKLLRLLNDARDIREWIEAEKLAGKTQSQYAALVGTKDPTANVGAGAWDQRNDDGTPTQNALWGKILKMAEGENFSMLSPSSRPTGAFMAFVDLLIRKMATSLNLPYGFLWDLSSLGGVGARIEVQGALRQIQYWQENILVNKILNRIRRKVLAEGIASGAIPAHPNWKKCDWYFGPWIITDAGYEMDNDIAGATTGIMPVADITAKYGKSPREVFLSNAETANTAIAVGQEQMVPVEAFAKGLYPDLTNQKAALITPPEEPAPGSLEAIGEKGFAEMVKLITAVKDGSMDHDSAVQTLITVLKFPRKLAETIVPDNPTPAELKIKNPAPAGGGPKSASSKKPSKPAPKKK